MHESSQSESEQKSQKFGWCNSRVLAFSNIYSVVRLRDLCVCVCVHTYMNIYIILAVYMKIVKKL